MLASSRRRVGAVGLRSCQRFCSTDEIPGLRRTAFRRKMAEKLKDAASPPPPPPLLVGPICRISHAKCKPHELDALRDAYDEAIPPLYAGVPGFAGAFLLLDRSKASAKSITMWESQADFEAAVANPEYGRAMSKLGAHFAAPPDVETWERGSAYLPSARGEESTE